MVYKCPWNVFIFFAFSTAAKLGLDFSRKPWNHAKYLYALYFMIILKRWPVIEGRYDTAARYIVLKLCPYDQKVSVWELEYSSTPGHAHFLIADACTIYCAQKNRSYGRTIVWTLYWRSVFIKLKIKLISCMYETNTVLSAAKSNCSVLCLVFTLL